MREIVVLFEVKPTKEGKSRYLELAAQLKPLLSGLKDLSEQKDSRV